MSSYTHSPSHLGNQRGEQGTPPGRQSAQPAQITAFSSTVKLQNLRVSVTFRSAAVKGLCLPWASRQLPSVSHFDQPSVLIVFHLAAFSAAEQ